MIEEGVIPACNNGEKGGCVVNSLNLSRDKQTINFTPRRTRTHSKQCRTLNAAVDLARGFLAAGQSVSEDDLFLRSTSRYRRRESLSALRILNRLYPKNTRLVLVSGIWILYPAVA